MGSRDRQLIEERYGPLGGGAAELAIGGRAYGLREVLRLVGQDFETVRPVDLAAFPDEGLYAIRFVDMEERVVVAFEFDAGFRYVREHRAHLAEWMGDEYYRFGWFVACTDTP